MVEQQAAVAEGRDHRQLMADEQDRPAAVGDLVHLAQAALLERHVAHGEDLVDEQDLGLEMGRHREARRTYMPLE